MLLTGKQIRVAFRALAQSPLGSALLVFLVALCVRILFGIAHPHFDNIFVVRGVPFSDGVTWTTAAISLAEGHGLGYVYRPGLSVALALFYTWFGYHSNTIIVLNILVGSLTAVFVFLVARVIFNKLIAAAAACFFVFDPSQLVQTPQATTEPLGLLFFAAAIYFLLLVNRGGKGKLATANPSSGGHAIIGGVLLGLSNLTRPLTLVCAPFYAGHVILSEWLRTRRVKRAIVPAIALCIGIVLTLSPWLVRQRLVHGVWSISTNLGEALYSATSPKYKTWTPLVRADADRAGVNPTFGARYNYFIAESIKNVRRDPMFYLRQIAGSYWQYLNCFDLKVRSSDKAFAFRQWTWLVESQVLFVWITAGLLVIGGMRTWLRSGMVAGCVFLVISFGLMTAWRVAPAHAGIIILAIGMVTSLMCCQWRNVALLSWSLLGAILGSALFNNAILYRAVLMTDWLFSLFYLAAFYFSAHIIANVVLRVLHRAPDRPLLHASTTADSLILPLGNRTKSRLGNAVAAPLWGVDMASTPCSERRTMPWLHRKHIYEMICKTILMGGVAILVLFLLAGSFRLLAINSGIIARSRPVSCDLSTQDKRDVIERLRAPSLGLRQVFGDPEKANIVFVEPTPPLTAPVSGKEAAEFATAASPARSARRNQVVIQCEPLSQYIYYFPRGTEFATRDPLFMKRTFDCSIFSSARSTVVFPGRIPRLLQGRTVVLVGWIEGIHPGWARLVRGEVMQCVALIPVSPNREFDYEHAEIVQPRATGILPARKR
jgi:4-amino-4-deoxy-L-arabinose transferase-like glycosyltransferase